MSAVCKFCNKKITAEHYFITKAGTVCRECKEKIHVQVCGITHVCDSVRSDSNK